MMLATKIACLHACLPDAYVRSPQFEPVRLSVTYITVIIYRSLSTLYLFLPKSSAEAASKCTCSTHWHCIDAGPPMYYVLYMQHIRKLVCVFFNRILIIKPLD